jgi:hypothetical protein
MPNFEHCSLCPPAFQAFFTIAGANVNGWLTEAEPTVRERLVELRQRTRVSPPTATYWRSRLICDMEHGPVPSYSVVITPTAGGPAQDVKVDAMCIA